MKTIDMDQTAPALPELLQMASEDNVLLRAADGREFLLAETDDFSLETALVRGQADLMAFLEERSRSSQTVTLEEVRQRLGLHHG
jgi:hypothetical protein